MAKKRREIERSLEILDDLAADRRYDAAWDVVAELSPEEVDSVHHLKLMAKVQEETKHYDEMKKTYLYLFNMTKARHNLKEYVKVLIRIGEFGEAKLYLKEFEKMDGAIADDFDLRYAMAEALELGIDEKIKLLEDFKKEEYMENWGQKLAELYGQAGRIEEKKRELADLHLWFGGVRIIPDDPDPDPGDQRVVDETSENLVAKLEAHSDIENAISESVGAEVSRIVEADDSRQQGGYVEVERSDQSEPTLDEMLSETGRMKIERLEVEQAPATGPIMLDPDVKTYAADPTGPIVAPVYAEGQAGGYAEQFYEAGQEQGYPEDQYMEEQEYDPAAPVVESVGAPVTASGEVPAEEEHLSFEAKYLNRKGQAETVGEPVKTDDAEKAKRVEQMFVVDDTYEEGPADISGRGIRYWTTTDVVSKLRRRDFEPPHFVLAGGDDRIVMTMAKKLAKELARLGYTSAKKVVRITAEKLNKLRLEDQIDKLIGNCLLITEAAELTKGTVEQLMAVMHEFGEEFVVVLAAPFDEMDCFLEIYPELAEQLGYKVRMVY